MRNRITDPKSLAGLIGGAVTEGISNPTIQFSQPGYSPRLLKVINGLCKKLGTGLEVRFYGHYKGEFDASVLAYLPDVQWLSVDCLLRIRNEEAISSLAKLRRLSFGVYEFEKADFLDSLGLSKLTHLRLSESRKRNLDLSYLSQCDDLADLHVVGHTKNISAVSNLAGLRTLQLGSMPKRLNLAFVNDLAGLESLGISLGGRESVDEIEHGGLSELEVIRVRGLNRLGNLARFPALRRLRVEDQIQLLDLSVAGTNLEEISIHNCKNFERIDGLLDLPNLRLFRTSRTLLDLDSLLNADWPPSMQTVGLYSSSRKWNDKARQLLDGRGYSAFPPRI